jgi:hypothetical protein
MVQIKTRPKYDKVKALAVKQTADHFDITDSYVRQVERGDADNEEIKRYYNETYFRIKKALTA